MMNYKFTKSANKSIELASDIATKLGHNYVGTEHLLYGLAQEDTGVANKVLERLNITPEKILEDIEDLIGKNDNDVNKILGFTPRIQKCTECSREDNLNYFSFKDNGLKCEDCSKQDTGAIRISESTKTALKYINMAPAQKLFSFNMSDTNKKQLEIIAKIYTNEKLEKEYKF